MEHILGSEWEITPAGGATGEAYFAQHDGRKLFLKRNSSPFLAVLSAEGIVPKLVWTKRMENGDVITAQHWLNGRELSPKDMDCENVARLLHKIHNSRELLDMMKRLGKKPLFPEQLLAEIKKRVSDDLSDISSVGEAFLVLEQDLPNVHSENMSVCHCDINHNNWLLSEEDQLYLIDWDGAMIADPAIDIGMLLHWYVKEEEWETWLTLYGLELTEDLIARMRWYVMAQNIITIHWYKTRNSDKELHYWLERLEKLLTAN